MMFSAVFLFALAAQDPAEAATATEPVVVEEEAAVAPQEPTPAIPVVPLTTAPPAPTPIAPPAPPPPAARPSRVLPASDRVDGLNDVATGAVQMTAGAGACCLGSCVAAPLVFVPVAGPLLVTVASPVVAGVAAGGAEVVVGDALGNKRGALLVPALTSVGLLAAGTAGGILYRVLIPLTPETTVRVAEFGESELRLGGDTLISTVFTIAAVVVPAIIYQTTAVEKEPGDRGGFPGFVEPADPTGTRAARTKTKTTTAPSPSSSSSSASSSSSQRY